MSATVRFRNRTDAGRQLAARLSGYAHTPDVIVLALPRGGVPVGFEVASSLSAPLDVMLVRKLGVPGHSELAMGAIAAGGVEVLSEALIKDLRIPQSLVQETVARELIELNRRDRSFRGGRPQPVVLNRTVILVDDGLATGSTMEAAVAAVRRQSPNRVVVAAPVGARDTCERLARLADEVVCLSIPDRFEAVGAWYEAFEQTSDEEVQAVLAAGQAGFDS